MIYITGDTHADFKHRFNMDNFPEQREMTKDDYVIICGDFGGVWNVGQESKNEKHWLDWFEERSYTLLFVDGNHENFDRLNSYPVKEWHGGKIHELRPHVLHLMRGQVFEIDEKKIFTFGGASSHDVTGGILETDDPDFKLKKKRLDKDLIISLAVISVLIATALLFFALFMFNVEISSKNISEVMVSYSGISSFVWLILLCRNC